MHNDLLFCKSKITGLTNQNITETRKLPARYQVNPKDNLNDEMHLATTGSDGGATGPPLPLRKHLRRMGLHSQRWKTQVTAGSASATDREFKLNSTEQLAGPVQRGLVVLRCLHDIV